MTAQLPDDILDQDVLAALRLPIPVDAIDPVIMGLQLCYGTPLSLESRGPFLVVLKQEAESDSNS